MSHTFSCMEFNAIEQQVRYGMHPDSACLLNRYIQYADNMVQSSDSQEEQLQILFRVANNLLEVICDTYLPVHWRHACMDVVYRPVHAMERLATTEKNAHQLHRFKQELNTLGNYFFN